MTDIATAELTADQARELEKAFLSGLNVAQDAYEQIVAAEAWTQLGYDTFADWWSGSVQPVMRALSMRPTREIAAAVVDQVRAEEAVLPPAQRRRDRELAEMVGATPDEIRTRAPRSSSAGIPTKDDLESPPPSLKPEPSAARPAFERGDAPAAISTPDFGPLDRQLDAEMDGTDQRFRRNFSAVMVKAVAIWQFDVDRIAEAYAADYDQAIRPHIDEMARWCERVRAARRDASGLRLVNGGAQ